MRYFLLVMLALLSGCQWMQAESLGTEAVTAHALPEWQSPREREHVRVGKIIDERTGRSLTAEQLVDELAGAALVLLGEKHDNPDHHALQLWLIQALEARRAQGSVVMEMLTVDQQPTVAQVQKQVRDGAVPADLPAALNWHKGWDWQQYSSLVSHIIAQPYPLLAGNLNRDALMDIYRQPPELAGFESTQTNVTERLAVHIRESHCNKLAEDKLPAMLAVQQQRDRTMAGVLLDAAKPTLLIAGAFHVRNDLGIPLHIKDLQNTDTPEQRVVIFAEADQRVTAGSADFVWYTPATPEKDYCADL